MHKQIPWDTINRDIDSLHASINIIHSKNKFDNIVAIGRGGLILATLLAYKNDISNIYNYGVKSYNDDNNQQEKLIEYQVPDFTQLRNTKVLLVDDLADKGTTFLHVVRKLQEYDINFQTCSLYIKKNTKYIPNFYIHSFSQDTWIVFPWDV